MRKYYFSIRRHFLRAASSSALLLFFLLAGMRASATVFPVTNGNNAGAGSLRQAIIDANAGGAGPHSITFGITGVINLASPLPAITNAGVTIDGGGNITVSAQGGEIDRDIFTINVGNTTLKGMTLQNTGSEAIQVNGTLNGVTIENITIRHTGGDFINHGIYVGGNSNNMTIRNVTITDVQNAYWGIRFVGNASNLTIDNFEISGGAGGSARGIQIQGVANNVTIRNSVIDLNSPTTTNDGDYGVYFNTTATAINIDSCSFKATEIYGVYFGAGASNIQIGHSDFDNRDGWTGNQMIRFNSNVSGVIIDSVQINSDLAGTTDDGDNAIYFNGNVQTLTIRKSTFTEADIDGVYFITGLNNDNILITENVFERNGSGGGAHSALHFTTIRNTSSDGGPIEVSNNIFRDNNGVGIYVRPTNGTTYVIPNFTIRNNTFTGNKVFGAIKINYIDKIVISQNSIYNNVGGIDLSDNTTANCGYEGANAPQLVSSGETTPGSGIYNISVRMPALCGTNACSLELFSNEAGVKGISAQHYVQTFTGLGSGVRTLTNVTGAFAGITSAPYGTWSATMRGAANCGTSEISNKIPILPNGPAGVSFGIKLWLRGDDISVAGSEPTASGQVITGWEEFSGGGAPSANTILGNPLTKLNGINFNPVADMDADGIRGTFAGGPTWMPTNAFTSVAVFNPLSASASGDRFFVLFSQASSSDANTNAAQIEFYRTGNNIQSYRGSTLLNPPIPGTTGVTALNRPGVFTSVTSATNHTAYYNGANMGSGNYSKGNLAASQWFIGTGYNAGWNYQAETDFAEVFTYNRVLTAIELQRVQSYMALKYGIALKQNYVLSDGTTTVWNVTTNAAHSKEVAALVRDNISVLHQKQAKAFHADEVVTIGIGSSLAATNNANEGNIANDKSVFMWGNDSASTLYNTPYITAYSDARMTRVWKVQKTNWSDTLLIIKLNGGNKNRTMIVSADPTFASGVTNYPLSDTGTVVLNSSAIGNGQYFTFANKISAPACVTTGIQAWYRADDRNAAVNAWTDYSGYDRTATQATAANQPIKVNSGINFNPAFDFDGSNDFLNIPHNLTIAGTNPFTILSVTKRGTVGTADMILGQQSDATNSLSYYYAASNKFALGPLGVGAVASTGTYPTANIPYMNAYTRSGNLFSLFTNGAVDGTGTQPYTFLNVNQRIGTRGGGGADYFDGNISELIVYNRALSNTELQTVGSYLALKYGITLNNGVADYLASDGTTKMRDASLNAVYNKDIAGIGKDTCGNLHQKQSRSINAGSIVTMALGDGIAPDNISNTFEVTNNLSFFTWGDNGGAAAYTMNVAGTNVTLRMPRVWKVDKTNWADQDVTIKLNGSPRNAYLLISNSDAAFATIDQEIAINDDSTITINTSLLPDGAYFTFGKQLLGPGYVNSNIVTWQRADDGISASDAWYDFSGNGNDARQAVIADQPGVINGASDTAINFNPGYLFKSSVEWFDYTSNLTLSGTGNKTVIWAARSMAVAATDQAILSHGAGGQNMLVLLHNNLNRPMAAVGGGGSTCSPVSLSAVPFGTALIGAYNRTSVSSATMYTNGAFPAASTCNSNFVASNVRIGARNSAAFNPFNGNIAEVIVYDRSLSDLEMQHVHSYLALKYGITLPQTTPTDYVATDWDGAAGTRYWTASKNTGYAFRIAGIGRDELTKLYQKQSRSVADANAVITIAAGSAIAVDNPSNTSTIDDMSFFTWSDNNQATTFTVPVTGVANATHRMARVWKIDRTNWADQDITIQADKIGTRYLLVNTTDPTFATGNTEYAINTTSSTVTINSAELPDGAYFTLATKIVGPGCVNNNVRAWLKPDYGHNGNTWIDFSGLQQTFTQATVANQPTFAAHGSNFNPALNFDGTDFYDMPNMYVGTDSITAFFVSRTNNLTDVNWPNLAEWGDDQPGMYWKGGRAHLWVDNTTTPNNQHTKVFDTKSAALFGFVVPNGNPKNYRIIANGNTETFTGADGTFTFNAANAGRRLGGVVTDASQINFNGHMSEVVFYKGVLTDPEIARVQSYFALKYGITLNNGADDYIASDGTTKMWTAADNAGYNFRITGIGRDDCDGLHQKQSLSQDSGLVAITIGDAVLPAIAENADTIINNNSYLVFADNNLDTTWSEPVAVTDITATVRMARVWKVDKTNWADRTIGIKYYRNPAGVYLLTSTDPTFATGVQEILLQASDSTAPFSSDQLPDGSYFTFGKEVYGPGYVNSGVRLWLRADQNIGSGGAGTAVTNWEDFSGNSVLFQQNGANPLPLFETQNVQFNFNPSLDFVSAGAEQMISLNSGSLISPATFDNYSMFAAVSKDVAANQRIFSMINTGGNGYVLDGNTAGRAGLSFEYENGVAIPVNQTKLVGVTNGASAATQRGYHNGKVTVDNTTTTSTMSDLVAGTAELGAANGAANFGGHMSEVIVYNRQVTPAEALRINSYLALKYGVTLDQTTPNNYVATDWDGTTGTIYWNAATNSGYNNNIAGIGRDDSTFLLQKQSRSVNAVNNGNMVAIGLESIAANNGANTGTFADDRTFLVWGDNGLTGMQTTEYPAELDVNGCSKVTRLAREWKVQETGTAGFVQVQFYLAGLSVPNSTTISDLSMLVDDDGDFGNGGTTVVTPTAYDAATQTVSFNDVELTNGEYFTLVTDVTNEAPGGVLTDLYTWYRADKGITATTTVSQWNDQSTSLKNVTGANQPAYNTAANLINFNPTLTFDGVNDVLNNTTIAHNATANGEDLFAVVLPTDGSTLRYVIGMGNATANYGTQLLFNGGVFQYASRTTTNQAISSGVNTLNQIQLINGNRSNAATNNANVVLNGTLLNTGTISNQPANTILSIGARRSAATNDLFHQGRIAEVAIYNRQLTNAEREKVASYMALKYGITLSHNYTYPNNTVVWDQAANTGYTNNITGIGRDDCNGLHQKQSKSVNAAGLVTVAFGQEVSASNALNLNALENNTALMAGDNNGAIDAWTATEAPGGRNRVAREWKVQLTGTVGVVTIQVPANTAPGTAKLPAETNKIYLLVDADGDFSTGAEEVLMTLNGNNWEANYEFTGNAYFTFATGTGSLLITSKVILQGAWNSTVMRTDLKTAGVLPATDPYGLNTTPSVTPSVTPAQVVDWVMLELRDPDNPTTVLSSRAAFVLANGDVVDTNYIQPLSFYGVDPGNYLVVVRHRNHLGVMTQDPVDFTSGSAIVDFSSSSVSTYGSNARKDLGSSVMGLWAGNVNGDQSIRHSAKPSDGSEVQSAVITHAGNTTGDPAYTGFINAYSPFDVNLDGRVYHTASPSDRGIISNNVLTHPGNIFGLATYIILQQLP